MNPFDIKAANWDTNPMHLERSEAIYQSIKHRIDLKPEMKALDFGAGTGILSFLLKDELNEITLMDSSAGMVDVMVEKIKTSNAGNLVPLLFDMENADYTEKSFDLIFSQMVMHHLSDVSSIFKKFYHLLNPGGYIAIADLYCEDGTFHNPDFNGHKGFDPAELGEILTDLGFTDISHSPCFIIHRLNQNDEINDYPVFLLVASK
jgi:tRNA (cmo5U34)-methyltransferase